MSIQSKVVFDGAINTSGSALVSYSRPFAISTLAGGTLAAAQVPSYGPSRLVIPPPSAPIVLDTDATALNQVFGGLWSDGGNCVVHYRQKSSPNSAYVNIWPNLAITANALTGQPATRSTNIRCTATGNKTTALVDILRGSPDEDANWVYAPFAFQIVQGVIIALCEAQTWTGSAWQAQAMGMVRWDEAAQQWRLMLRGKTRNAGGTRGREWVASQFWILDGQSIASSREIMLCWADYGVNGSPVSNGGQLFICMLTRAAATDPWTIGTPVMLHEATDAGSHHFHNAAAYRPTGVSGGVAITLSVGDSGMAEQLVFYRADASTYAQGWDSGTKVATASATDGASQNGWTTLRKSSGYPSTLAATKATGFNQWMGVAPIDGDPTRMVVSNDEKQNTVLLMNLPNPFADPTRKTTFELLPRDPVPSNTLRRGHLAFGIWSETSRRRNFVTIRRNNSKSNASVSPTFGNPIAVSYSPASLFPQGFSAAVGEANTRVLYSVDGLDWGVLWSPNAALRPAVIPGYALFGGLSSFGKVVAIPFSATVTRRPLLVSPGSTQYQITSAAQAEAPTTGNTVATVPSESFNVVDAIVTGRVIPPPPSNGPVIRWTVGTGAANKYAGARTLTTGTPLLISDRDPAGGATFQYMHVGIWVYQLPPSVPYGGDDVAPFNSAPTGFRAQIMRANTAAASYEAAGDVDSVDGSGWRYYTFSTSTQQWGGDVSANANVAMRLKDDGSGGLMDCLICFDRITITSAPTPTPLPVHPLPVGAAATLAPSVIDSDRCIVGGLACSATWSVDLLGMIPEGGWDQYLPVEYLPANPALCTLVDGQNRKIFVRADPVTRRLVVTDGTNSVSVAPPAGEEWVFERGMPIAVSLSCNGTALEITASVGNTQVSTGSLTLALPVRPVSIHLADEAVAPIQSMEWISVAWDNNNASDASTRAARLTSIDAANPLSTSAVSVMTDIAVPVSRTRLSFTASRYVFVTNTGGKPVRVYMPDGSTPSVYPGTMVTVRSMASLTYLDVEAIDAPSTIALHAPNNVLF